MKNNNKKEFKILIKTTKITQLENEHLERQHFHLGIFS